MLSYNVVMFRALCSIACLTLVGAPAPGFYPGSVPYSLGYYGGSPHSSSGTLTAALAARQGGININSGTVDQILSLPEPTVRAVFGRSKKDIVERLLGLDSSENFNLNELRTNPTLLRSLRGMSLAKALDILGRDDDDYDPLRLHHSYGSHLGHNHLGSGLYPHRYRGDSRYYDDRYNSIDDDSYSLGSFLPLTGAATTNKSYLLTFVVVLLQMILFK